SWADLKPPRAAMAKFLVVSVAETSEQDPGRRILGAVSFVRPGTAPSSLRSELCFRVFGQFLIRIRDGYQRIPVDRVLRKVCIASCVLGALTPRRWISLMWRWRIHAKANQRRHNGVPLCERCVHASRAISPSEFYELPHGQQGVCTPRR